MSKSMQPNALLFGPLFTERGLLATLVVGQVIATIIAFAPATSQDTWVRLGIISLFIQLTFLFSLSGLYIFRHQLKKHSQLIQTICLFTSLFITTTLMSFLAIGLIENMTEISKPWSFIFNNLLIVFLVACLFVQFLAIYFEKQLQTQALARAELDALQARIRPHFLYNSLNTAAELTHCDPEAAEQAILALAALSQAALKVGEAVALEDEIALTKQYVSLESWRFGDRLKMNWQLPDSLPQISIPCLTLQPIVENAICHGVEPSPEGANINIQLNVSKQSLTFLIENPVHILKFNRAGNGMALDNIRQRLNLYYQGRASLNINIRDATFRVKLVLPLQSVRLA
ncbi:sensor histidine kinase [Pseudoalteromonas sp. H105]|uniref:sensor histidine kinase n=1 Tax=Pseudoalteromonas sp. H105 TaxID=1348393 RepID=UPI000731FE1F|nr:histidine kinase [Pseudoalteromonas sp. H105]KTF16310.1 alginate biosynthesis protein [Pseudoalteromonas sp. H105]